MIRKLLAGALGVGAGALALRTALRQRRTIDLAGKVVFITGGSRGLGLALARRFAEEGARLAITARSEEDLQAAAADLRGRGANVLAVPSDVREEAQAQSVVERIVDHFGRLDVLVNNAGVIQVGPLAEMEKADFAEAMETHFWGAYHCTQAALPHLGRPEPSARIVNIASVGGLVAVPHLAPYSASKFALVGYSDGLRAELAGRGIQVTTVCPGLMRTGSHANAFFKGQHEKEYAWFSLSNAFPLFSMDAGHAARKIVRACKQGDPALTLTLPAKVLALGSRFAPRFFAESMTLAGSLLPSAGGAEGRERRRGRESQSKVSPSAMSAPADRAAPEHNEGPRPE